ncbi:MAG: SigB/SigF/SigG family RNA polymerase sigma factor [Actinomycetes bacterium]
MPAKERDDEGPLDGPAARVLFVQLHAPGVSEGDKLAIRERLVRGHLGLVQHLARRYDGRGEPTEDLIQVGSLGLLKAIERFDLNHDVEFVSFAVPTVLGEIKRHFRDKGWSIRVPRQVQEVRLAVGKVTEQLTHELSRSPTIAELAERLGIGEDDVIAGLEGAQAYRPQPLDPAADPEANAPALVDVLGVTEPQFDRVEIRATLRPLLEALPERERRLLEMRFFREMTQTEIAGELGISQMHVSRLLSQTLARLRQELDASGD